MLDPTIPSALSGRLPMPRSYCIEGRTNFKEPRQAALPSEVNLERSRTSFPQLASTSTDFLPSSATWRTPRRILGKFMSSTNSAKILLLAKDANSSETIFSGNVQMSSWSPLQPPTHVCTFTTSWKPWAHTPCIPLYRLHLYDIKESLNTHALYYDTDSTCTTSCNPWTLTSCTTTPTPPVRHHEILEHLRPVPRHRLHLYDIMESWTPTPWTTTPTPLVRHHEILEHLRPVPRHRLHLYDIMESWTPTSCTTTPTPPVRHHGTLNTHALYHDTDSTCTTSWNPWTPTSCTATPTPPVRHHGILEHLRPVLRHRLHLYDIMEPLNTHALYHDTESTCTTS